MKFACSNRGYDGEEGLKKILSSESQGEIA